MTTYLVSRHKGAHDWAMEQEIDYDFIVEHLDPAQVQSGDTVIGSLPVNLAAEVCANGGRYCHLSLIVPPQLRGMEMSAVQLNALGAEVREFDVRSIGPGCG